MLSGRRMPSSSANFAAGMILPRAIPAMSGMMASTSEIPWSRKNCWISLAMGGPFLVHVFARGCPECREQRPREWIGGDLPFGMPLHGYRETRGQLHPEGFDQPIRRAGLDDQSL